MESKPAKIKLSDLGKSIQVGFSSPPKRERNKGLSLTYMPSSYCCIDIETTGYMPAFNEIIEFCGVRVREENITDTYSTLIKPLNPVDEFITELTGITNEMLEDQPSIEDVAINILEFLGDDILLGHNVHFDINFLYDKFEDVLNINLKNDFVDLLRFSRRIFTDFKNHWLVTIARELKVPQSVWHRAEADCNTTIACFEKCRKHVQENNIEIDALFGKRNNNHKLRASMIVSKTDEYDIDHPLYGKTCVFTGVLEKMLRRDAMQNVVNLGGRCKDTVTNDTDILVLGNNEYCSTIKDGKSNKQKRAEGLILRGHDLKIIPEDVFYDLLERKC